MPVGAIFRFKATGAHLTYRTHIPFPIIRETLIGLNGALQWWSFVHETSDAENPYDHTHVAWQWTKKQPLDLRSNIRFDITGIHPNIQKWTNVAHKTTVYENYHNKPTVIARDKSELGPTSDQTLIQQIRGARSLAEAIELAEVTIRTVGDVNLIRNDKIRMKDYVHRFPNSNWIDSMPIYGTPSWRTGTALYIWGDTGLAKTQWAVHQSENPLVLSHMDKLRDYDEDRHDMIIFDDMSFNHVPRTTIIHLTDWDEARQIHCRYSPAEIPAMTKKIFTSNKPFHETFSGLEGNAGYDPAILRRVSIFKLTEKAYTDRIIQEEDDEDDLDNTADSLARVIASL